MRRATREKSRAERLAAGPRKAWRRDLRLDKGEGGHRIRRLSLAGISRWPMRDLREAETAPTVQCQVKGRKGRRPGEAGRVLPEGWQSLLGDLVELPPGWCFETPSLPFLLETTSRGSGGSLFPFLTNCSILCLVFCNDRGIAVVDANSNARGRRKYSLTALSDPPLVVC